jgi:uncharacterized phage protein gp47/JayE
MLDEKGLKIPSYAGLLEDMEIKAKELFGDNINLSSNTPLGIIIRIFAWFLSITWQVIEKVYHSGFIKSSEGIQLDRHGKNRNITRNPSSESTVFLSFTGEPYHVIEIGNYFETEEGVQFMNIYECTLNELGTGIVESVSVEKGAYTNVFVNSVIIISEPVAELYTVTNVLEAVGGSNQESDTSYRDRLIQGNIAQNNAILNAIYSKVTSLSGVISVKINVNDTMSEVDGVAPKSINVMCVGGNNDEIGKTIFKTIAAGVGTSGEHSYMAEALDGNLHEIRFSKAVSGPVYIQVKVDVNEEFPLDGVTRIKDSIIEYVGGNTSEDLYYNGLDLSEALIYTKLFHTIYSILGVENATSVLVGTEKLALKAEDVIPAPKTVLVTEALNIEVILNVV